MNRRGFSLVEVIISVAILAIVAVYLFQISSSTKTNIAFLNDKASFATKASLLMVHNNQNFHNSDKDLYEYVREQYEIKDDDLRRYLKSQKLHYEQEEFTTFSPLSDGDEETIDDQNQSMIDFTLVFDKIIVSDKKSATYAYKIYMR